MQDEAGYLWEIQPRGFAKPFGKSVFVELDHLEHRVCRVHFFANE